MRCLAIVFATAVAVTAQSPLTTTFANNNGGALGGAVYFELECLDPAGLTISDIDLNFGSASVSGSIDVYLKAGSFAPHTSSDWVGPVTSGTVASVNSPGTPTNVVLSTPLELGSGCKFGVAIVCIGDLQHAYTTATSLPSTFATAELELTVGGASNTPFTGGLFSPRLVNINIPYVAGGTCPDIASCTPRGDGCVASFGSFYEVMTAANFDLSGMKLTATNNGSGYDLTLAPGSGFAVPLGATNLNLGDDTQIDTSTVGGTLGMWVGSNGWMARGSGNSNGFVPSVTTFLANPAEGVYSWTDLQPNAAGSGAVFYSEFGTVATATYNMVYGWGTTEENNIKIQYDTSNGDWSIEWETVGSGNPEDWLIGYSPGGASLDPGATDISVAAPFSIGDGDNPALALKCIGRPVQDPNSATDFCVETCNINPDAFVHLGVIGFSDPGMSLSFLGFPESCNLYVFPAVPRLHLFTPPTQSAPSEYTWCPITLPPLSAAVFSGFEFSVQAVTLEFSFTNLTSRASNAVDCVVGSL